MKTPTRKGAGKHLDDEDHALWSHAARSVKPLAGAKSRHHPAQDAAKGAQDHGKTAAKPAGAKSETKPKSAANLQAQSHPAPRAASRPAAKAESALASVDRKRVRKIRTGQVEIEARIDLHGMRQDEAHAALSRFLHRCHSREQRWVLVITGKGRTSETDDYMPFDLSARTQRGVLKRNVPRWLEEPELRPLIIGYTMASAAHGGEGALYVHLRKRR